MEESGTAGWMVEFLVEREWDGWMVALLVGREQDGRMVELQVGREWDGCGVCGWEREGRLDGVGWRCW